MPLNALIFLSTFFLEFQNGIYNQINTRELIPNNYLIVIIKDSTIAKAKFVVEQ